MSLYSELRTLSPLPEYQEAIDILESGTLPIHERQALVLQALRAIAPKVPAGKERMKECFWGQILAFAPIAVVGSIPLQERKAKWMLEYRQRAERNGRQWPPRQLIRHRFFQATTYSLRFID